MPTYQYACTACDHRFEAVQSFSDASLTDCPTCTGALRKVFSSVGIVFKGSGFYRTDSRAGAGAGSTVANGENGSKNGSSDNGGEKSSSSSEKSSSDKSSSEKSSSSNGKSTSSTASSTSTPAPAKS